MSVNPYSHEPGDPHGTKSNLPRWARRDEGPMNTYVPGPISSAPLVNSYDWGKPVLITGVIGLVIIGIIAWQQQAGWFEASAFIVFVWAGFSATRWLRGRAGMRVEDDTMTVRRWFEETSFRGAEVSSVQYIHNGFSPDFKVRLADGRRVYLATSRLEKGHSTLFEWLRRFAPQTVYDKKSIDIRDRLVHRGLIAPYEQVDNPDPGEVTTREASGLVRPGSQRERLAASGEGTVRPDESSNPEEPPAEGNGTTS